MVRNKSSPAKSMNVGQSGGAGKAMRGANAMYGNLVAEVATEESHPQSVRRLDAPSCCLGPGPR